MSEDRTQELIILKHSIFAIRERVKMCLLSLDALDAQVDNFLPEDSPDVGPIDYEKRFKRIRRVKFGTDNDRTDRNRKHGAGG